MREFSLPVIKTCGRTVETKSFLVVEEIFSNQRGKGDYSTNGVERQPLYNKIY